MNSDLRLENKIASVTPSSHPDSNSRQSSARMMHAQRFAILIRSTQDWSTEPVALDCYNNSQSVQSVVSGWCNFDISRVPNIDCTATSDTDLLSCAAHPAMMQTAGSQLYGSPERLGRKSHLPEYGAEGPDVGRQAGSSRADLLRGDVSQCAQRFCRQVGVTRSEHLAQPHV